jgi:hypothetical protein
MLIRSKKNYRYMRRNEKTGARGKAIRKVP